MCLVISLFPKLTISYQQQWSSLQDKCMLSLTVGCSEVNQSDWTSYISVALRGFLKVSFEVEAQKPIQFFIIRTITHLHTYTQWLLQNSYSPDSQTIPEKLVHMSFPQHLLCNICLYQVMLLFFISGPISHLQESMFFHPKFRIIITISIFSSRLWIFVLWVTWDSRETD